MKTEQHSPFLAQLLAYLDQHNSGEKQGLIFPNQLAIDYFHSLLHSAGRPTTPSCLTMHQLIVTHLSMQEETTFALLPSLYTLIHSILNQSITFEQFYPFGVALLEDFNRIDQFLVDVDKLFSAVWQKSSAFPLSHQNFMDNHLIDQNERCPSWQPEASFWQKLPIVYHHFTQQLIAQGKGYSGLLYRKAATTAPSTIPYDQLVFIGFNRLTYAEESFIMQCQDKINITFFWDIDSHYIDNPINIAGHYLRQHMAKSIFQHSFTRQPRNHLQKGNKHIEYRAMPNAIAQIQSIIDDLKQHTAAQPTRYLQQTALVIGNNHLLVPLLDKLATHAIPLHYRLDYPLVSTVIYIFLQRLIRFWEAANKQAYHNGLLSIATVVQDQEIMHHLADSLALLYPLVGQVMQAAITAILDQPHRQQPDCKRQTPLLAPFAFLLPMHEPLNPFGYLKKVLLFIDNNFSADSTCFAHVNRRALRYLCAHLDAWMTIAQDGPSLSFFLNSCKKHQIPIHQHNPSNGLYIIEITQSHGMDFKNLFFLDMTEGFFPNMHYPDSLLSYDIRKGFNLPLEDKVAESTTAYGFYRLLQRSQHICCSYTKQDGHAHTMHPLLLQLTFDNKTPIIQRDYAMHFAIGHIPSITIEKNGSVRQLLEKFLIQESKVTATLTPSALISYIRCPLQFYFAYLLGLKPSIPTQTMALSFGSLFHNILHKLYLPLIGKKVAPSSIMQLKAKVKVAIQDALMCSQVEKSMHKLYAALLEQVVKGLLTLDSANMPFELLGCEMAVTHTLTIDGQKKIGLRGIIDRIVQKEDSIEIVDYKTGLVDGKFQDIQALFDSTTIEQHKSIFQLIFYSWLIWSTWSTKGSNPKLIPYFISAKGFFSASYPSTIFLQHTSQTNHPPIAEDISAYLPSFENALQTLLSAIVDPTLSFKQTEELKICASCPYAGICQRD